MKGPPARHDEPQEVFPAVEGIISDADELERGDRVVYPNQGVCRITGVEVKDIAGQRLELVRMEREEDGAAVLVPKAKVPTVGLRRVASPDQIEGVFHFLAAQFEDPELDWKVRHRDNADRLIAGGVLGVAEVVKGLHSLSRIRPLPTKEREQYDNARHLLVHEISVSLAVPPALAEDYVDYALMPPAGVVFHLKPPPLPVQLPVRPRRRIVRPAEEEDDLGLESLGIDLGGADVEIAGGGLDLDVPLPAVEGAEAAEGGEALDEAAAAGGAGEEEAGAEGEEEHEELPLPIAVKRSAVKPPPAHKKPVAAAPAKPGKAVAAKLDKDKAHAPPAHAKAKPDKGPSRAAEKKPAASKAEKKKAAARPSKPVKVAKPPAKATKAAKPAPKKPAKKAAAVRKPDKAARKPARGGAKK